MNKKFEPAWICIILLFFIILALSSQSYKSPTFDEPIHLTGGYTALTLRDYRINPENGLFPQIWGALPLGLDKNIKFSPKQQAAWQKCNGWTISDGFIFNSGNNFEKIFGPARTMIIIIAVMGGLVVYFATREIFGRKGAYISLILYSFSPTVAAHSRLVTSDICAAVFFLLGTWLFWQLLNRFTILRLISLSVALSLLAVSKMSAPIILPVMVLITVIRILLNKKLRIDWKGTSYYIKSRLKQTTLIFSTLLFCGIVVYCLIWTFYGFRYTMLSDERGREQIDKAWEVILESNSLPTRVLSSSRKYHLLPEAYIFGLGHVLKKSTARCSFLNGAYSSTGWSYFFPMCFLMKTPISIIILFLLGLLLPIRVRKSKPQSFVMLWKLTFPLALIMVYCLFSIFSNDNIGQRHLLPIYLPIFIISGGTVLTLKKNRKSGLLFIGLLCLLLFCENLLIFPNYLAYFNPPSGGSAKGYKHLVDSSLDWGQDLKGLKEYLSKKQKNTPPHVYIAYFGTVDLNRYQMNEKRLLCYFEQNLNDLFHLKGGIYCISATMLQMVYWPEFAKFGPEQEQLFQDYQKSFKEIYIAYQKPDKLNEMIKRKGRDS